MSAVVMALTRWEPRIEIIGVDFAADNADLSVTIEAERTDIPASRGHSPFQSTGDVHERTDRFKPITDPSMWWKQSILKPC